jgi:hypothetical protein
VIKSALPGSQPVKPEFAGNAKPLDTIDARVSDNPKLRDF